MSLRSISLSSRAILRRSYGTVNNKFPFPNVLQEATTASVPRTNWTRDEVKEIYETPLSQLTYAAVFSLSFLSIRHLYRPVQS